MKSFQVLLGIGLYLTAVTGQSSQFSFSSYYRDHMVLQRSYGGNTIWGFSSKVGDIVHLEVNNVEVANATVDSQHIWTIKMANTKWKGNGPYNISASSSLGQIKITDVWFGDVWVCSGQSNMEFIVSRLINTTDELNDTANYQNIRLMHITHTFSNVKKGDINHASVGWALPSADSLKQFSSVCWLFGKYLSQHMNYPIGLVQTTWGGTPIEAWSSPDAIHACPTTTGKRNAHSTNELYNAMIYPLLRNTIKGAIWYQGESNSGRASSYACQFQAMISDWRKKFNQFSLGTTNSIFPFGFVQLAPTGTGIGSTHGFSEIRWAQTGDIGHVPNYKLPRVFMAVAIDLPDSASPYGSVHPRYKHDVARRLVLAALGVAYYQKGIEYQGPYPSSYSFDKIHHTLTVEFDHGRTPIEVRNNTGFEVCCVTHRAHCTDFEHAWMYVPIKSHSTSDVSLDTTSCASNHHIGGVRYAWRTSPCALRQCPIYGRDTSLPTPPFKYLANVH